MTFPDAFKSTLFWRLLIGICTANLLVLALGTWLAQGLIAITQEQRIDWTALAQQANDAYSSHGIAGLENWCRKQATDGINATLYENGQPLAPISLPSEIEQQLPAWIKAHRTIELNPSSGYFIAVVQVEGIDQPPRQLVAATSPRGRMSRRAKERIVFIVEASLFIFFIIIIGWRTARSVSRPIEAMRDAANRMAKGDLSARIPPSWSKTANEFGVLSRDFNRMAERMEALVSHERAILQDLSHELRSPLARLLASVHLVRRNVEADAGLRHLDSAEQEVSRIDRITSEMLALSRLEADLPGMEREWVDLASLTQARLEAANPEAQAKSIHMHLSHTGPTRVFGSEILLERVIDNLVSNAIKYSDTNGMVEVVISNLANGVELRMRDHGPGVREEDMGFLFRPFFRGANAHLAGGNGLGLSVVRRIMSIHDGDVFLRNAQPRGLEATLVFSGAAFPDGMSA
jgi:two-component system, OmpR family, sensor kinase